MRTAQVAAALGAAFLMGGAACGGTRPPAARPDVPDRPMPAAERPAGSTDRPRVSGRMRTADGRQLLSAAIIMVALDRDTPTPATADVQVHPDGSFAFLNMPPGTYQIRARADTEPGGTPLVATFRLVIHDRDVTNLQLLLAPGAEVTGTLHVDARGHHRLPSTGVRVRAPFSDGSSFGDAVMGDLAPDGSFTIRGLMNGSHVLALEGLPDPWVLQSVTYREQDITDTGLDVESGQRLAGVRITVTDVASEVSGRVTGDTGAPAARALVAVVPVAAEFRTRASRRLRTVRADGTGHYLFRGLPAGDYLLAASIDRQEEDVYREAVLQELIARGTPLHLAGPEARVVDLRVTASIAPGPAAR